MPAWQGRSIYVPVLPSSTVLAHSCLHLQQARAEPHKRLLGGTLLAPCCALPYSLLHALHPAGDSKRGAACTT